MSISPARASFRRASALPPCCLPGGGTSAASFLEALDARPSALLALAAALMLALGASPVHAQDMTVLCTSDGPRQVPVEDKSGPDSNMGGCAHLCLMRDRRRG